MHGGRGRRAPDTGKSSLITHYLRGGFAETKFTLVGHLGVAGPGLAEHMGKQAQWEERGQLRVTGSQGRQGPWPGLSCLSLGPVCWPRGSSGCLGGNLTWVWALIGKGWGPSSATRVRPQLSTGGWPAPCPSPSCGFLARGQLGCRAGRHLALGQALKADVVPSGRPLWGQRLHPGNGERLGEKPDLSGALGTGPRGRCWCWSVSLGALAWHLLTGATGVPSQSPGSLVVLPVPRPKRQRVLGLGLGWPHMPLSLSLLGTLVLCPDWVGLALLPHPWSGRGSASLMKAPALPPAQALRCSSGPEFGQNSGRAAACAPGLSQAVPGVSAHHRFTGCKRLALHTRGLWGLWPHVAE